MGERGDGMSYLGKEVKLTARVIEEERSFLDSSWSNPKLVLELPNGTKFKVPELHLGLMVDAPKYIVVDKRLDVTFSCLGYAIEDGVWFWANKKAFLSNENVRLDHTQQQLIDAGFEEVFENPNYEVKEVEKRQLYLKNQL